MELISRGFDRLPIWAKAVLGLLAVVGSIYLIAREGIWVFLLKLIFSP
jgi:hypothetical protein